MLKIHRQELLRQRGGVPRERDCRARAGDRRVALAAGRWRPRLSRSNRDLGFSSTPSEEKPCKSCSFWADGYNGVTQHLAARDTRLVAVSCAPKRKARGDCGADGLDLSLVLVRRRRLQLRLRRLVPSRIYGGRRRGPLQLRLDRDDNDRPAGSAPSSRSPDGRSIAPIRPMRAASTC